MSPCIWYISKYVILPSGSEPPSRGYGLMRELARLGYRTAILTSDSMGKFSAPAAERRIMREQREGVTICRVRTMRYQNSKSIRRILSWFHFELRLLTLPNDVLPVPDVVVVSSLSLLTVLNGLRIRRKYNCRMVFEVRDIWPLTLVEEGGFSPRNPFVLGLGLIEKVGYRRADAVVGTMPNLSAHVKAVTGRSISVTCIPMGVDEGSLSDGDVLPDDYVTSNLPPGKFIIAYAGSIGVSNALDVLFECAERMRDEERIHFVVVGEGELRQRFIDRFGSLPNVTFAPWIPKSQVQDLLSRCDVLYLSTLNSRVWDFGLSLNKLIDYMLAARPIIASYSGFRSMIDEADCGTFVPAGDANALCQEVRRYAELATTDLESIGGRGRSWLLQNRTYQALAQDYLSVLVPQDNPAATQPQRVKVLHLTQTSVPADARIRRELRALCDMSNLDVFAYGALQVGSTRESNRYALHEFRMLSAVARCLPRPVAYALFMLEMNARYTARLLLLRPDVVHCHDTMVLPAGVLAKMLLKARLIYDAHELESDKSGQSRVLSRATLLIEKLGWPFIDRLVTVSPSIAEWYSANLGPKSTVCILNSPELTRIPAQPGEGTSSSIRQSLLIDAEVPLFVYVGALEPGRGVDLLLESFSGADVDAHVAFVGTGSLRNMVERSAQTHVNVHYSPPVPHQYLLDYIQDATGGLCIIEDVSLSDRYCLPNKLFEYAFAGLPVVASRLPDIEELVRTHNLGVCTDPNPSAIREAVSDLARRPRRLRSEDLESLSWASQAGALRSLYSGLVRAR